MNAVSLQLVEDVVALYVDPRGPYPKLVRHWFDQARDARTYAGPWPVVAHPPCRNYSALRHLAKGDDSDCAVRAVEQVRAFGGVLEHPRGSTLWTRCSLPMPGELPDAFGGRTIEVQQVDWGHPARKKTWLYLVGLHSVPAGPPPGRVTHWCSGFRSSTHATSKRYRSNGCAVPPGIKVCSAQQRRRTPIEFARWLVSLARQARVSEAIR